MNSPVGDVFTEAKQEAMAAIQTEASLYIIGKALEPRVSVLAAFSMRVWSPLVAEFKRVAGVGVRQHMAGAYFGRSNDRHGR